MFKNNTKKKTGKQVLQVIVQKKQQTTPTLTWCRTFAHCLIVFKYSKNCLEKIVK